jgi:hypothetical protein
MAASPIKALSNSVSENEKRQQIRNYFKKPNLIWPIGLLVVGLLMLMQSSNAGSGTIILLIGGAWLFFELKSVTDAPSDQTVDSWLIDDIEHLKKRSMERLNIEESELIRDHPVIIRGPILWTTYGIPAAELAWKKGKDEYTRFSINAVTVVHLTKNKLSSYQCDYNFIKGVPLNERDDEFHYRDVVAVSTRDESTNYALPNGKLMKQAQLFQLAVSSGDRIKVVVNSPDLLEFTGGSISDTGLDNAVKALRKVLGEKKI